MTSDLPAPKLYLLTNDDDFDVLYRKLTVALATGVVSYLQIRRKGVKQNIEQLRQEITAIVKLANEYNCDVIINDDMELAHEFGVGVHLGQGDGNVAQARELLGESAIIGNTCHGSLDLVEQAIKQGASYGAMGAVFDSTTKPNADIIPLSVLQQGSELCHGAGIGFCVIGGLTSQNISELNGLSVDYFAVVNDVLGGTVENVAIQCALWKEALINYYENDL